MFTMSRVVPINRSGDAQPLTREQVWKGLCMKARDGRAFVPGMTHCAVVSEGDGVLVRELSVNHGPIFRERITFHADKLIVFEHVSGPQQSVVLNQLESDVGGELQLRYTFLIEMAGVPPGSAEERKLAADTGKMPFAVDATVDTLHRMAAAGTL